VVKDRPQFIQERRAAAGSVSVVISKRSYEPGLSYFSIQQTERGRKNDRLLAPAAQPAIASKNLDLFLLC
jgi:hypothetical protein